MDHAESERRKKAELLNDCQPWPIDDTLVEIIETGNMELTDGLFFELLTETPAYLATAPFLKRISQWQYMMGNPIFNDDEQNAAKKNLRRMGTTLSLQSVGRHPRISPEVVYRKYTALLRDIESIFKEKGAEAGRRLGTYLALRPQYKHLFDLRGKRRPRAPKAIAVAIVTGLLEISESHFRELIQQYTAYKPRPE